MINLIFDIDDTAYDQLKPFESAFKTVFGTANQLKIESLYVKSRFYSDEVYHRVVRGEMPKAEMHVYRITQALADFDYQITKREAEAFQRAYEQNQRKIELSPGIKEILTWAKKNQITMGIITNGPKEHQQHKINDLQINDWIPVANTFISGKVGIEKPDKKIFDLVAKQIGIDGVETYYIGDSFENDVIGSKNAGWHSIWLNRRGHLEPEDAAYYPDYCVENEQELFALLQEIF
ncbi:HAD family hydrolase [Listeria cossartiae subsp. cayugensis]|uniref:HAD family hydrolase n=1 Tax=Listeria cossartiae TaxID=2838249 RepID=UPI0028804951|nr:HAD family hydrolase [Listeria cossartiae]MDT0001331.1 HAD family hydrolase [Listeria cossartiae subsp. cayugensis]MDT0009447.1 HAD family hydrolase [Listeria cossartiae subsp. cayugensis]MDT0031361.1 HAD family hydrolase [Listeria cossartiae subsp. cayugensis]MDT0039477.1 HAD family hydrolase [Listeria cossartiae subsp. cayugensis]MDT0044744.1 HAD family hydrolase [Listeria cossartiae subsp. cayugensis]